MRGWARADSSPARSRTPDPPPDWTTTRRCNSSSSSSVRNRIVLSQPPIELAVLLEDVRRGLGKVAVGLGQPTADTVAEQLLGRDPGLARQLAEPPGLLVRERD